ncbi:protein anon-73B1, putative [Pediculus humanus corporis]|uniref:Protein anon-73B1, putative n=1 Tax=Pediculus humanus subsp. corporis TaxID=121224 RepID=E0VX27_PEDHC|nr:protein anon-73B1, putative [Pediculus humanus corporis]EEB17933.1 protein anon-73B1, putative [Pediculus humanus corporis]
MSEDFYDTILRCGLYFGAVFQLICIAAVVIIPDNSSSGSGNSKDLDGSENEISDQNSPLASPRKPHIHHRSRKPDKKKRR